MVSKDEVVNVANMAKLKFNDEEIDLFTKRFTEMVELADKIMEVDTEGVEPTLNINGAGHFKDYNEVETLDREEVLKNTTENQYGYFKILKVVE